MPKLGSESDYAITALPNYTSGIGYYTSHTEVSDLLQVGAFTSTSVPSIAMIGKIIKRVEGKVDDTIKVGDMVNPNSMMAINLQGVVAVLTKALQEAVARIEALESK